MITTPREKRTNKSRYIQKPCIDIHVNSLTDHGFSSPSLTLIHRHKYSTWSFIFLSSGKESGRQFFRRNERQFSQKVKISFIHVSVSPFRSTWMKFSFSTTKLSFTYPLKIGDHFLPNKSETRRNEQVSYANRSRKRDASICIRDAVNIAVCSLGVSAVTLSYRFSLGAFTFTCSFPPLLHPPRPPIAGKTLLSSSGIGQVLEYLTPTLLKRSVTFVNSREREISVSSNFSRYTEKTKRNGSPRENYGHFLTTMNCLVA